MDSKIMCNLIYCLVGWFKYMPNNCTWEPRKNVVNVAELVQESHYAILIRRVLAHALQHETHHEKSRIELS